MASGWMRLIVALGALSTARAAAGEEPQAWYRQIAIDAFVAASYTWNFDRPPSGQNLFRAFDTDHDVFSLDAAELVVQRPVAKPGEVGFRVDLTLGAVARVAAARGLFRDPVTGKSQDIDLQQAFVSYVIPLGRGLRLDVGKFVTPAGAEVIEGYDGYDDELSRSLLFTLAIPFTHTGLRLSYPFNDKLSATFVLMNGWDNVLDNNAAKSFGLSLAILPTEKWSIYVTYLAGPERDHDDADFRHLADLVVVYRPTPRLSFALNGDYGFDANAIAPGHSAQWVGAAAYARVQLTGRFALALRGEAFWDLDGFRTGQVERLLEATLTSEVKLADGFLLRGELRIDQSDRAVFERAGGAPGHLQPTLAVSALYAF